MSKINFNETLTPKDLSRTTPDSLKDAQTMFINEFGKTKRKYFVDIRVKDLDSMIKKHGFDDLFVKGEQFSDVYKFVSARETNNTVKCWTIAIGIMTLVILLCTIKMTYFA